MGFDKCHVSTTTVSYRIQSTLEQCGIRGADPLHSEKSVFNFSSFTVIKTSWALCIYSYIHSLNFDFFVQHYSCEGVLVHLDNKNKTP